MQINKGGRWVLKKKVLIVLGLLVMLTIVIPNIIQKTRLLKSNNVEKIVFHYQHDEITITDKEEVDEILSDVNSTFYLLKPISPGAKSGKVCTVIIIGESGEVKTIEYSGNYIKPGKYLKYFGNQRVLKALSKYYLKSKM
jgi:hypothetical protein